MVSFDNIGFSAANRVPRHDYNFPGSSRQSQEGDPDADACTRMPNQCRSREDAN